MGLRKRVALGGAMLTAIAAGLSLSEKAIALPLADQTDGQLISQVTNPTNRLDQVRAEVVSVSNDGDVRVRLPDGSYRTLPNVNPQVLNSLRPGDEILITVTPGNDIVNVAIAPDTVQQASVDEPDDTTQAETVDDTDQETVRESTTETTVQRETVRQETTPLPVSEPERITPVPVTSTPATPPPAPRALW